MKIYSFSPFGYEGSLVAVEVDLRRGIPAIDMVGLADSAVKESRERMKSAIRNSGYEFPPERILISLSPADLKKEGAGFDLPIAIAVLIAKNNSDPESNDDFNQNCSPTNPQPKNSGPSLLILGELELNGKVRPVRGVHAAVTTAKYTGINYCIVPTANASEAREVSGMKVFGADNLNQAFEALNNLELFTEKSSSPNIALNGFPKEAIEINGIFFPPVEPGFDFADIKGQENLIRALQIAAAGGHNVLSYGAPGCGKTLSMQRFSSLLPYLSQEKSQSVTRIYSLAGLLPSDTSIINRPPFRMPHQTATIEGICGGGQRLNPGEISLAHNGVLFLDEAAEFKTSVLQMLRVPLESGQITLSRAGRSTTFPAKFQLLMATNPCPCGNFGSKEKICLCSARSVEQYWKKFSGPLLDRIEMRVRVENKIDAAPSKSTDELRKEIASALKIQKFRQGFYNAEMTPAEIVEYCSLDSQCENYMEKAAEKFQFSPRGVAGCIKVARTIADMEEMENISINHLREAVELRQTEDIMI